MSIARVYRMIAAEGKEEALAAALAELAATLRGQPGCEGIECLRDLDMPGSMIFVEKWASADAHKACLGQLPPDALAPTMAALSDPPEGAYMEYMLTA